MAKMRLHSIPVLIPFRDEGDFSKLCKMKHC